LPFIYNGNNADLIIARRVPDFYSNNRQVIEIFGEAFHNPRKSFFNIPFRRTKEGTINHYEKFGFNCLVIWDFELKQPQKVMEKIKEFSLSN